MKQNETLKMTLSFDHGVVSQHVGSGSDVLQNGSKQRLYTTATSEMSLRLLSAHRLPAVPQFEVDTDHGDPFAVS